MAIMRLEVTGLDEAISNTSLLRRAVEAGLVQGVDWVAEQLLDKAVLNAPILTGALRGNLFKSPLRRAGNATEVNVETVGIPYATWVHEAEYNLGPVSMQQPSTSEGGVGKKFMDRPARIYFGTAWAMGVLLAINDKLTRLTV